MNTLLSLVLWMWLPIALGAKLRCIHCEFERPGPGCLLHRPPCRIHVGESCYKKTVFYGNTPLYTEKGCVRDCMTLHEPKSAMNITDVVRCCSDTEFCNR